MGIGAPARGYPTWSIDEEASRALIRHALESGIDFFDTANLHSNGASEEIVGRASRDFVHRDAAVIATKIVRRQMIWDSLRSSGMEALVLLG